MKTHFLKSFLKEKSLNVFLIFHFWSMIFFFFTNAWPHTSEDITCSFINYLGITLFIHGFFSFCFQKQIHVFICSFITMKHVGVSLVFQKRYDIISWRPLICLFVMKSMKKLKKTVVFANLIKHYFHDVAEWDPPF